MIVVSEGDFGSASDGELAQVYIDNILARMAAKHVGRINRLYDRSNAIMRELKSRGTARIMLEQVARHHDPRVRTTAQSDLECLDRIKGNPAPAYVPPRGEYLWQCNTPPPGAMARAEIERRLGRALPEYRDALVSLMRPAIGLWPQRWRESMALTASRFGGTPLAPAGWQWPTVEGEPLLFVGQINCGELKGLPAAESLPPSGLLVFFADHDAVHGCRMEALADIAVYHWAGSLELVPAVAPIEPSQVLPQCALAFRPIIDLPDPFSKAIQRLRLNEEDAMLYAAEWREIRCHGVPYALEPYISFSKLFGWLALVQWQDLDAVIFSNSDDPSLLLQVDEYCNTEEVQSWAGGGSIYFLLPERDLIAGNFAACSFDVQFT